MKHTRSSGVTVYIRRSDAEVNVALNYRRITCGITQARIVFIQRDVFMSRRGAPGIELL